MESLLRHAPASTASSARQDERDAAELYAAPETSALTTNADGASVLEESLKTRLQDSKEKKVPEPEPTLQLPQETVAAGKSSKPVAPARAKTNAGARRVWQAVALSLLLIAIGAAALAFYYSRARSGGGVDGTAPISISDQQRRVEEKLTEAERLMAEGNVTDAIARLRYAIKLDPSNARAHRMLADALERMGNVNEAIDEYRVATELDPGNEETKLRYADALRRVGRIDEARDIYQKLSSSSSEEVARTAKEKLAQMPSAPASNTGQAREQGGAEGSDNAAAAPPAATQGTAAPTAPTSGGGKPGRDPVASYNRAMKIVEGKDIRKMNRADLILAYTLFQYAQRGPNAADATRHLRELDNELFVRRKRNQ